MSEYLLVLIVLAATPEYEGWVGEACFLVCRRLPTSLEHLEGGQDGDFVSLLFLKTLVPS